MRRIIVVLTAAALMAVMTMAMAAPAMAQEWTFCDPDTGLCSTGNPDTGTGGNGLDVDDCRWVWSSEANDSFLVCDVD
jgi:hypothetical protein